MVTLKNPQSLLIASRSTRAAVSLWEPGFQNSIEGFNGLWQSKVWQRHHCRNLTALEDVSARYIAAHHAKTAVRREAAPARRRFPASFAFDLRAPLAGTMIFLRRSNERGEVNLL